jgi:hypothetical protein
MTTIKQQMTNLKNEIMLNQQADNSKHILSELETIREPLSKANSVIQSMLNSYQILQNLPEDAPENIEFSQEIKDGAKTAKFAIETFYIRWQQDGHQARQGDDFANTLSSLKSVLSSCQTTITNCWQKWVHAIEVDIHLEPVLLKSQKNIPGLKQVYEDFILYRDRFQELTRRFPEDKNIINDLIHLHEQLVNLKGKMQFDLPKDVGAFFKALDNLHHQVSLTLLTTDVIEWLKNHDMLDKFVVSRRGRG